MIVRLSEDALKDLDEIYNFIALDKPDAAAGVIEDILQLLSRLAKHPNLGREGRRLAGTGELILSPFLIVYRIRDEAVEILSVFHGSRTH